MEEEEIQVSEDDIRNEMIREWCGKVTKNKLPEICLLYTSPSPRDRQKSRMPSSA